MGKRIDLHAEVTSALNSLNCQRSSLWVLKRDFHKREADLQREIAQKTADLQHLRRRFETADSEIARLDLEIANFSVTDRLARERIIQTGGMTPGEKDIAKKDHKRYLTKKKIEKLRKQLAELES